MKLANHEYDNYYKELEDLDKNLDTDLDKTDKQ